jgi:hypothetical protein
LVTLEVMMSGNERGCCCGVVGGLRLLLHVQLQTSGGGAGAGRRVLHSGRLQLLHYLGHLDDTPELAAGDVVAAVAVRMLPSLLSGSGQAAGLMDPLQLRPWVVMLHALLPVLIIPAAEVVALLVVAATQEGGVVLRVVLFLALAVTAGARVLSLCAAHGLHLQHSAAQELHGAVLLV